MSTSLFLVVGVAGGDDPVVVGVGVGSSFSCAAVGG